MATSYDVLPIYWEILTNDGVNVTAKNIKTGATFNGTADDFNTLIATIPDDGPTAYSPTFASDVEAKAGTDNSKEMTSLRTREAVFPALAAAAAKTTAVNADKLPLVDSEDAGVPKNITLANIKIAILNNADKAALVGGDKLAVIDSEAANAPKTITVTELKALLKTYFDTLYVAQ